MHWYVAGVAREIGIGSISPHRLVDRPSHPACEVRRSRAARGLLRRTQGTLIDESVIGPWRSRENQARAVPFRIDFHQRVVTAGIFGSFHRSALGKQRLR